MRGVVCAVLAALLVVGCRQTSSRYEGQEVGQPMEAVHATVLASRIVDISAQADNPTGPLAGGALGGASAGWAAQSGWAAVIGGVLGAGVGYVAQEAVGGREGIEYIVQMTDGRTVTLVQNRDGGEVPLANGTHVLVQTGSKFTRIIPAPAGAPMPAADVPPTDGDGTAASRSSSYRAPPPPPPAAGTSSSGWGPPVTNSSGY